MADNYYNKVNVLNLPRVNVINDDDYLIVQNDNNDTQTSLLQFKNFVIDLKNTTFATAVENLQNNVNLNINRIQYIADQYNGFLAALSTTEITSISSQVGNYYIDLNSIA